MNLGNIGISGLILILIVLLLLFGPSKLPELGRAFGKSLREFKEATRGLVDEASPDAAAPRRRSESADARAAGQVSAARVEPIELKEDDPGV